MIIEVCEKMEVTKGAVFISADKDQHAASLSAGCLQTKRKN